MQWFVYMIKCEDGKLYTGLTDNVARRFNEHRHKGAHFTSYNHAVELIYKEAFSDKHLAAKREQQIKGWTRAKKMALACGNLALLKKL